MCCFISINAAKERSIDVKRLTVLAEEAEPELGIMAERLQVEIRVRFIVCWRR